MASRSEKERDGGWRSTEEREREEREIARKEGCFALSTRANSINVRVHPRRGGERVLCA